MRRPSRALLVPVRQDSEHGLTLYEVVGGGVALGLGTAPTHGSQLDIGEQEVHYHQRGTITGILLGILVFLGGIALLALTFKLAIDMFTTDPNKLFGLEAKTLDLSKAVATLMAVVVKVLLLLVMAIVGGLIANRGIHLYADSRHSSKAVVIKEKRDEPARRRARRDADDDEHDLTA